VLGVKAVSVPLVLSLCSLGQQPNVGQIKVKVKSALEQAMKAQRGSRGIALLFL
jgi:hypothetical protein